MLQHFQIQSLYKEKKLPGWLFSFYFGQQKFKGIYHPDGTIEWQSKSPEGKHLSVLEKQIHDLMIYHIYDHQR
ncbi:YheE family protein [Bacillus sp. IITD106]|nr:YheE family protein [Bacillus sp. IITD106]